MRRFPADAGRLDPNLSSRQQHARLDQLKRFLLLLFLFFALPGGGCGGTVCSSSPLYPSDWPPIVRDASSEQPPDLSGTYRAVSEPAGPLVYPSGGDPYQMVMFIPVGGPIATPTLGRRLLPHYFAGIGHDQQLQQREVFYFLAELDPDEDHPDGHEDRGWVRLTRKPVDNCYRVEFGVDGLPPHAFDFDPRKAPAWHQDLLHLTNANSMYDGALKYYGVLLVSHAESSNGRLGTSGATFTVYKAADGSIVILESPYWAQAGGEVVFKKWWRWRRIDDAPPTSPPLPLQLNARETP